MMANYNKEEEIKPPYMVKLQESRVRELPSDKSKASSKHRTRDEKADILTLYGLGIDDYSHVKQKKDNQKSEWKNSDVQNVVNYYLKAATLGGNPAEPQPSVMCECCMDINDHNKKHRNHVSLGPNPAIQGIKPKEGSRPPSPEVVAVAPKGLKQVRFVGMGDKQPVVPAIPFYRTDYEGPAMVAENNYSGAPSQEVMRDYDDFLSENRKLFVTHPVKRSLFSTWGVNEEVTGFSRDRYMAEDVVVASSKYVDSMQRLKKYSNDRH